MSPGLREALRDESPDFVAALLAAEPWPWQAAYLASLPRARRAAVTARLRLARVANPSPHACGCQLIEIGRKSGQTTFRTKSLEMCLPRFFRPDPGSESYGRNNLRAPVAKDTRMLAARRRASPVVVALHEAPAEAVPAAPPVDVHAECRVRERDAVAECGAKLEAQMRASSRRRAKGARAEGREQGAAEGREAAEAEARAARQSQAKRFEALMEAIDKRHEAALGATADGAVAIGFAAACRIPRRHDRHGRGRARHRRPAAPARARRRARDGGGCTPRISRCCATPPRWPRSRTSVPSSSSRTRSLAARRLLRRHRGRHAREPSCNRSSTRCNAALTGAR
jgi:hypothetical protein